MRQVKLPFKFIASATSFGIRRTYPLLPTDRLRADFNYFTQLLQTQRQTSKKAALKIRFPFCAPICSFCKYYKFLKTAGRAKEYLSALKKEISMYAETNYVRSTEFGAVYCTGGTPTSLSTSQITDFFSYYKKLLNIDRDAEVIIEARSHDLKQAKLEVLSKVGINWLSIGVVSFDTSSRRLLGKVSSREALISAIKRAQRMGFEINIDLIYNLPSQSAEDSKKDLQKAIDLEVGQICIFPLEVYPGSKLTKLLSPGEVKRMGDKHVEKKMYEGAFKVLVDAGYKLQCIPYGFSLPRKEQMWREICAGSTSSNECLALGAGTLGKVGKYVYRNVMNFYGYINFIQNERFPIEAGGKQSRDDEMRYFIINSLGLSRLDLREFKRKFNMSLDDAFRNELRALKHERLIMRKGSEIKLTHLGILNGTHVFWEFYPKKYLQIIKRMTTYG